MARVDEIKAFVQDTLGCGCSDEVFRIIEAAQRTLDGRPYTRINVGNRLLVYVFEAHVSGMTESEVERIASAGKEERDRLEFNRFRLALASGDPLLRAAAGKAFSRPGFPDDRLHLHVIGENEAAFLR
jgi:hypothetical protein